MPTCEEIQSKIDKLKKEEKEYFESVINRIVPVDVLKMINTYGFEIIKKPIPKAERLYSPDDIIVKIGDIKRELFNLETEQKMKLCRSTDPVYPPIYPKKRKPYKKRYT